MGFIRESRILRLDPFRSGMKHMYPDEPGKEACVTGLPFISPQKKDFVPLRAKVLFLIFTGLYPFADPYYLPSITSVKFLIMTIGVFWLSLPKGLSMRILAIFFGSRPLLLPRTAARFRSFTSAMTAP